MHFASSVTLDFGELRGPQGDQGKDSRNLAANSWFCWQEAFWEWVKVALCNLAQHGGKWTRIWAMGELAKESCLFALMSPVLSCRVGIPHFSIIFVDVHSLQLSDSWTRCI